MADYRPDEGSHGGEGGHTGLIIGICAGIAVLLLVCGGIAVALLVPATQNVRLAAERVMKSNDLKQIGLAYYEHRDRFKKPPATPEDLKPFLLDEGGESVVYDKLKAGAYVILYNADLQAMPQGGGATILGYERDVPVKGGAVLFGDGSVRNLTVEEFRIAPQAKPGEGERK